MPVKIRGSDSRCDFDEIPFIVDTGCTFTVIPEWMAHRLDLTISTGRPIVIELATESKDQMSLTVNKRVKVELDVGGFRRPWSVLIADVTSPLLGSDFLAPANYLVDMGRMCIVSRNGKRKVQAASKRDIEFFIMSDPKARTANDPGARRRLMRLFNEPDLVKVDHITISSRNEVDIEPHSTKYVLINANPQMKGSFKPYAIKTAPDCKVQVMGGVIREGDDFVLVSNPTSRTIRILRDDLVAYGDATTEEDIVAPVMTVDKEGQVRATSKSKKKGQEGLL